MRRMALVAVSWSALLAAGVIAMPAAYADDTTPTCAPLPVWVQGQPAHLHVLGATGDYLWHDGDGWHLRVTHRTKRRLVFSGSITASSPITFTRVRDESRDKVALSDDHKKLTFRFVNYGGIDGVDFGDACAQTTRFALAIDGHRARLSQLYIGRHSSRPRSDPFTISRHSSTQAA